MKLPGSTFTPWRNHTEPTTMRTVPMILKVIFMFSRCRNARDYNSLTGPLVVERSLGVDYLLLSDSPSKRSLPYGTNTSSWSRCRMRMTERNAGTRMDQSRGPARAADYKERLERKLATLGDPFLKKLRGG
jgi:hypothetical protein